jgi:hypothetical protein
MPQTEVRAYLDIQGHIPIAIWLNELERSEPKAWKKCLARILELNEKGNEMRRPHADMLRDGIYELRATFQGNIHYRILYFFFGKNAVCLSHGTSKEQRVDPQDIETAIARKKQVERAPDRFTADFDLE